MLNKSLLLVAVFVFAACAPASDEAKPPLIEITNAEAVHDKNANDYKLSWQTDMAGAPVSVFVSTDPSDSSPERIAENVTSGSFTWMAEGEPERRYFTIIPDEAGAPVKTAVRLLPLEGGRNFRDLGGYETEDGKTVKWGSVYRSGVMHKLTDTDYDYLSDLGIKVICDFRESDERVREATKWGAGDINYMTFADPAEEGDPRDNPMFAALLSDTSTPEDVAQGMADGYFNIAMQEREGYTQMFDALAGGQAPLAFNCSAGKDRAGTAAALILSALGVPRETVVHDYSLSDDYVDYMEEFAGDEARREAMNDPDNPYAFLMQLPPEKLAPLMASHPRYIETSLGEMEERYGSVLGFIQTELDVTDEELTAIRTSLLN